MAKKELSQLYCVKKEIKTQQRRLGEPKTAAMPCNSKITGLPRMMKDSIREMKYKSTSIKTKNNARPYYTN